MENLFNDDVKPSSNENKRTREQLRELVATAQQEGLDTNPIVQQIEKCEWFHEVRVGHQLRTRCLG